jgi:multiple sugar transport system ATP-binding protein
MNFLHGAIRREGVRLVFLENNGKGQPVKIVLNAALSEKAATRVDQPVILGLRPESILTATPADSVASLRIEVAEPMGAETFLSLTSGAHSMIARVNPNHRFALDQPFAASFDLEHAHLFDPSTEQAL